MTDRERDARTTQILLYLPQLPQPLQLSQNTPSTQGVTSSFLAALQTQ
ncbi:MAG: hypothetical protein F6K31_07950 [Symploca sp. SIO2G7]|nr:hypothetical protein [Symploca sp. SIO2G7]